MRNRWDNDGVVVEVEWDYGDEGVVVHEVWPEGVDVAGLEDVLERFARVQMSRVAAGLEWRDGGWV